MEVVSEITRILNGRVVLVTGSTGFIGNHLVAALNKLGSIVHVVERSNLSYPSQIGKRTKDITVHTADLTNNEQTRKVIAELGSVASAPPIIFHLAAWAHVGQSWEQLYATFQNNSIGTLNLLQAVVAEKLALHSFVTAGTVEEFGSIDDDPSPYAVSKIIASLFGRSYRQSYDLPIVHTRMSNNFGPGQKPNFFTPTVITQALMREKIVIGNPDAVRDYLYVLDGVQGQLYAATLGKPGAIYSFGYGRSIRVLEWAEQIVRVGTEMGIWGDKKIVVDETRFRRGMLEKKPIAVQYELFNKDLGWTPSYTSQDALRETIHYYDSNRTDWINKVDW